MRGRHVAAALAVAAAGMAAACSPGGAVSPSPAAIIVTFEVNEGERFRVLLTDPVDQEAANRLLDGVEGPDIPNGRIVRRDRRERGLVLVARSRRLRVRGR